jgi:glycosyltransferase involved in cell wall biosynthesis
MKAHPAMVRTLLIHQNFVDHEHAGGTRHYELARHLVDHGHAVTIVAGNVGYLSGRPVVETKRLVIEQNLDGIRLLRAYVHPSLHRSFPWRVVSFLSFTASSFWAGLRAGPLDVVWGTSPPLLQLLSTWLVALIKRRPLVLEIRDLWPEFAIDMGVLKNRFLIHAARWAETFFYARARHIIVNSPAYRDYLIAKGVPAERITIIPNGVDPQMFAPDSNGQAIRDQWGLAGQFVVTYTGALGQANDIMTILRAAAQLRNQTQIYFLLVGDGKEKPNLEQYARSHDLSHVIFTGTYPKNRMHEVLAASDVCLATLLDIPMFRTTYPNKVFDYMAAGRPTILAIDGVIRQVIQQADGGLFVSPGDDAALASAILTLKNDPAHARAMGRAARRYVTDHFDRRTHAQQLAELLGNLVSRKKGTKGTS